MKLNSKILIFFFLLFHVFCLSTEQCSEGCTVCQSARCYECALPFSLTATGVCFKRNGLVNNCKIYGESQKCIECQMLYKLSGQICIQDASGCLQYDNEKCLRCGFGKILSSENICTGTLNCKEYKQDGKCVSCSNGFSLINNQCFPADYNCKSVDWKLGICIQCKSGFQLNGFICIPYQMTFKKGCAVMNQDGSCRYCSSGYNLRDYMCIRNRKNLQNLSKNIIKQKQSSNILNKIKGCLEIDQNTRKCAKCDKQFLQIQGFCIQKQKKITSKLLRNLLTGLVNTIPQSQQTSTNKILNCLTYSNNGSCVQCIQSTKLINNRCFYYTNQSNPCAKIHPLTGTCFICKYLYVLISGSCITDLSNQVSIANCDTVVQNLCTKCSNGYWNNNNNCVLNIKNCQFYDDTTGTCLWCKVGYIPANNICLNQDFYCALYDQQGICLACKPHFYYDSLSEKCISVSPLCKNYNNLTGACTQCYINYILANNSCIIAPPIQGNDSNCKIMNVFGICSLCKYNYYLSKNTKKCTQIVRHCQQMNYSTDLCSSCNTYYILWNNQCNNSNTDPNCATAEGKDCLKCTAKYFLYSGVCKLWPLYCGAIDDTTGLCSSCFSGYVLNGTQCQKFVKSPLCKTYIGTSCTQCISRYYLSGSNCAIVNNLCNNYDMRNGNCLTCFPGYRVENNSCVIYHEDKNCISWNNITCKQCHSGFILVNNKCKVQTNLCQTMNNNGQCTSCYPGYFIVNGACTTEVNTDPNCRQKLGPVCLACSDRFWLNNNTCKEVNTQCQQYEPTTGNCTSCYFGYILNNASGCVVMGPRDNYCAIIQEIGKCQTCIPGFYPDSKGCTMISQLCQSFDYAAKVCTSCTSGNFLQDSTCITPAHGLDPFCLHYTAGFCDTCITKFYISSYSCSQVDSNCANFNYTTSTCIQCAPNFVAIADKCIQM